MSDAIWAGTVTMTGHGGDEIEAYLARPEDPAPRGAVVVIHHMPGYDAPTKEMTRRFAAEGYLALCPNLFYREAPGAAPDDAAATVRAAGGVPDDRLVGDVEGAAAYLRALPNSNGKVGVIGHCSGGRHAFLAACSLQLDAAVDCYGAFVVGHPPENVPLKVTPVIGLAPALSCPLLGLFGNDDSYPSPAQMTELGAELDRLGKPYEFYFFEGAGHAFFAVNRLAYRPEAATAGWGHIFRFFGEHLATPAGAKVGS
jgi:carboxymethylenebutenolidase